MNNKFTSLLMALAIAGCSSSKDSSTVSGKQTYIDVHHLGAGNVTAAAVAEAHQKDLNVQHNHGVNFKEYWVDETSGNVYCVSTAPSEGSITTTHKEAHGLVPDEIMQLVAGKEAKMHGKGNLYVDVHEMGPGAVTPEDVAKAHEADLKVQGNYQVNFVNYWVDPQSGKIFCLSESPSEDAVKEAHKAAHGLVPQGVFQVVQGK